jgi:ABC-2 type transport system ATP-binding protein
VHWLRTFLRRFADSGRTVLLSSHVLAEVAQTVDSVLIMAHGRLAATIAIRDLPDGARSLEQLYLELTAREPA